MEPALKEGDLVLLRDGRGGTPGLGEVVVFRDGNDPVIHRVIEVRAGAGGVRLLTKGDNNPAPDREIAAGEVEARLVTELPLLGDISRASGLGGGYDVYRYAASGTAMLLLAACALATLARRRRRGASAVPLP
jgi:signal peptidase I